MSGFPHVHRTLSRQVFGHVDVCVWESHESIRVEGWMYSPFTCIDKIAILHGDGLHSVQHIQDILKDRSDVIGFYTSYVKTCTLDRSRVYGFSCVFRVPQTVKILHYVLCVIHTNEDTPDPVFRVSPVSSRPHPPRDEIDIDVIFIQPEIKTPTLLVVDNFYPEPHKIRDLALSLDYSPNIKYHKGQRTTRSFTPSWIPDVFGRLLGCRVKDMVGATGVFQFCTAQDPVVYHHDTQDYAAIVYLTPDAPLQSGTSLFRSKTTGLYRSATQRDADEMNTTIDKLNALTFHHNDFYDRHHYELVDCIGNVFNRLIIFDAQCIHAATSYFGQSLEDSRLFHLFFFNLTPPV